LKKPWVALRYNVNRLPAAGFYQNRRRVLKSDDSLIAALKIEYADWWLAMTSWWPRRRRFKRKRGSKKRAG
jgi:hypothetical protein